MNQLDFNINGILYCLEAKCSDVAADNGDGRVSTSREGLLVASPEGETIVGVASD